MRVRPGTAARVSPLMPVDGGLTLQAPNLTKIAVVAALAALAVAACGGGDEPKDAPRVEGEPTTVSSPTPVIDGDTILVPAPIRDIVVEFAGDPPEYTLFVLSGQPNSCEVFEDFSVALDGQFVRIEVRNRRTIDPPRPCVNVLRTTQSRIEIGSGFTPGETYTVVVNGFPESFTVPGGPPTPEPTQPPTPEPTAAPVPLGPVRVERVSVFLQEVQTIGVASFQALVLTASSERAEGATVSASLQGPVGSENLQSIVLEVETDRNGIADFRFQIREGGTYLFTVEFVFGGGAEFDREASKQTFAFAEIELP